MTINFPDPDRPLRADIQHQIGATLANGPYGFWATGPVWVIVAMLAKELDRSGPLTERQRCNLYLSACDKLLGRRYAGCSSECEVGVREALSVFAKMLAVTNR